MSITKVSNKIAVSGRTISKKISILHLITELNVGGAERMLEKLVTHMDNRKFHNTVVSMTDIGIVGKGIVDSGISVYPLDMQNGKASISGIWKLVRLLKSTQADILQTWLYHADLLGLIAGKLSGTDKIVWGLRCSNVEMNNYRKLSNMVLGINKGLSKIPDLIIANSHNGAGNHKKLGFNGKRMKVIPNGVDTKLFHPDNQARKKMIQDLGIPENSILIGQVARWDPMKDYFSFLSAASELAYKYNVVHFVLAGEGITKDNPHLKPFVQDKHLKNRLHLLGLRQDIQKIFPALDMLTSSSAYGEGFSNTICEAMSCGVPCVVTDVGDSAYIVQQTGNVIPPRDPKAMVDAWVDLIEMGIERRKELGAAARQRIQENFDIHKIVKQFEDTYANLLING